MRCSCPSEVSYQQLKYDNELQADVEAAALQVSNAVGYSFLLSVSTNEAAQLVAPWFLLAPRS